jgi:hypothetical protein
LESFLTKSLYRSCQRSSPITLGSGEGSGLFEGLSAAEQIIPQATPRDIIPVDEF